MQIEINCPHIYNSVTECFLQHNKSFHCVKNQFEDQVNEMPTSLILITLHEERLQLAFANVNAPKATILFLWHCHCFEV